MFNTQTNWGTIYDFDPPIISMMYIMWVHPIEYAGKTFYVFGTSQKSSVVTIYDATDHIYWMGSLGGSGFPLWKIGGKLLSAYGEDTEAVLHKNITQYIAGMLPKIEWFNELCKNGADRRSAYIEAFIENYKKMGRPGMTSENFDKWLTANFTTDAGKLALKEWVEGVPPDLII